MFLAARAILLSMRASEDFGPPSLIGHLASVDVKQHERGKKGGGGGGGFGCAENCLRLSK